MAVTTSGYCKITGLSKAMPKVHYIPMMPALSQNEQSQLFGCKITMASHMDHHYVPIIEFGKGKGPGVVSCKITGRMAHTIVKEVPMPEPTSGEIKRVHHYRQDYRYMEPFVSRLANEGERNAMNELLERMRNKTELDTCHYFIYALNDRRTGKTGLVLPYEFEEAVRTGAIEQILLSGDSNSLVVRIKDGLTCTIPMDKVTKKQIESLAQDELLFDGHGPDREIIETQRREKAAREKEDRDQMAQYLAEMEKKRKDREIAKKEKMKETMKKKMAEAEESERRQKEREEEIKKQYEEAAQIRADAQAAKIAARDQRLAERERKALEEKARRTEEMARLADEATEREEAEMKAKEDVLFAEEAAAAAALASINPYDLSVNELLEHVGGSVGGDSALLKQLQDAANTGMSSTQLAELVSASAQEAIEEVFESEDEEVEEEDDNLLDELKEEEGLDEEERERRRKAREAKRLERQKKKDEQAEEKRKAKAERERKKQDMYERLAAIRRGDAADDAENLKMPEMRDMPTIEIKRRKRPADITIPQDMEDEYVVRTPGGREVRSGGEVDDESLVEGRISPNSSRMEPGRLMRTKDGREFIAGRIIALEDGEEEFVPGKAVDLPDGPKFVPGQTVATKDGPRFVAGRTFVERENVTFVPGHVVDLGGEAGEVFVPGQVMDTIDGPKFIPGSVFESQRGPLFVPGQVRNCEFIPGEIVETEDGPRFITPDFAKEKVFTFMVQSFDLHPIEIDIVRYQYHSPQPSPTFEGQDMAEALNLMQMAAKGYQVKMLPLPDTIPTPPKSKRQIYENVQVTLLECLDRVQQAADTSRDGVAPEEFVIRQAKRLQRVLLDDMDCPVSTNRSVTFLGRFVTLPGAMEELVNWMEGLFWHTERGIFQTAEDLPRKPDKFGSHVSLLSVLNQLTCHVTPMLEDARKRDTALHELAELLNKSPPARTYVLQLAQRCQLLLSRLLLTAGKEILYAVYMSLCRSNKAVVFSILDTVASRLVQAGSDHEAVTALEMVICGRVTDVSQPWLEQILCQLRGSERSADLSNYIHEAIGLAILEREPDAAILLQLCLEVSPVTDLVTLHNTSIKLLHILLALYVLVDNDQPQRGHLKKLTKNRQDLRGNVQWITLLCGAKLITEYSGVRARCLETVGDLPSDVITLLVETDTPNLERAFHTVVLASTSLIHGADLACEPGPPVVLLSPQFEGVIPNLQTRDVINGKVAYLTVNASGIRMYRVGELDSDHQERLEKAQKKYPRSKGRIEDNSSVQIHREATPEVKENGGGKDVHQAVRAEEPQQQVDCVEITAGQQAADQNPECQTVDPDVAETDRIAIDETNVAPQETNVAPRETDVAPPVTDVAPLKTEVSPSETGVSPSETDVIPSETSALPTATGVLDGFCHKADQTDLKESADNEEKRPNASEISDASTRPVNATESSNGRWNVLDVQDPEQTTGLQQDNVTEAATVAADRETAPLQADSNESQSDDVPVVSSQDALSEHSNLSQQQAIPLDD